MQEHDQHRSAHHEDDVTVAPAHEPQPAVLKTLAPAGAFAAAGTVEPAVGAGAAVFWP